MHHAAHPPMYSRACPKHRFEATDDEGKACGKDSRSSSRWAFRAPCATCLFAFQNTLFQAKPNKDRAHSHLHPPNWRCITCQGAWYLRFVEELYRASWVEIPRFVHSTKQCRDDCECDKHRPSHCLRTSAHPVDRDRQRGLPTKNLSIP